MTTKTYWYLKCPCCKHFLQKAEVERNGNGKKKKILFCPSCKKHFFFNLKEVEI